MTIAVREALPGEWGAIGELTVEAYRVFPEVADDAGYVAELRDVARRARACPIYVAVDDADGRVVGGAMYVPGPANEYAEVERDGEAGIRMLAVAPDRQGAGIGEGLVRALIERARGEGRTGMALMSLPSMRAAHRLYARLGFRRAQDRDWEYEPGHSLFCFDIRFATDEDPTVGPAPGPGRGAAPDGVA